VALASAAALGALLHPITSAWLPLPARVSIGAFIALATCTAWREASRCWRIERRGSYWYVDALVRSANGRRELRRRWITAGTLRAGGHRCGTHLVLPFVGSDGRPRSLTVWRDALPGSRFSRLHLAMLASVPAPEPSTGGGARTGKRQRYATLGDRRPAEPRS